ncbi:type II toxin-antitoxin system TacA family antitoxin [Paraburkholderia acidipaludis]|uniref:type II toxin-antitoxin system TacA family antitoxin n=1 Tax=Paraburkholderia acidipaludis TaxID=660537 RepID=UPI000488BEA3|nr:DUF1778 domain-containing protein [Paraburkholderia acidipaludis]
MTNTQKSAPKNEVREPLNIRIPLETRQIIDRAAESKGQTRTEFILNASRSAAEEALLDSVLFQVSPEAFQAFLERLDAPPSPNERLIRLMNRAPAWERDA